MVSLRWAWAPEPASWLEGAPFLKIPRLGQRSRAEPVYPWDSFPAHPKGAMMIIKRLNVTVAAILVFRVSMFLHAAPAANRRR